MLPFQIKICGVTTPDDALYACQCGADAIGLNFYERSSRFVDGETAGLIAASVDHHNRQIHKSGNLEVKKIGVFVDMPVAEMVAIAWHVGLDGIQLHGDESPEIIESIRAALDATGHQCVLIRAIRSKPKNFDEEAEALELERKRVVTDVVNWIEVGIDLILLDAAVPGEYGGTGKTVDWATIPEVNGAIPLTLAGGLTPENVGNAILKSGLQSVDVASGVESAPGVKDPQKVRAFVEAARNSLDLAGQ